MDFRQPKAGLLIKIHNATNTTHYLEKAGTHKSAKNNKNEPVWFLHNLVTFTFDLFNPKINRFPGLIVGHFYVMFGDPSCSGFRDIVRNNRLYKNNSE